ncbi:hypothetical protein HEP87_02990 [Streptomyces sp. S1D4-11]|nr:hypothetical protein [Streptomyces sp. S1D4-11]QIY93320.1 hypothetical protein HEP87_02990 [Streptomyces sp. S1D4-11]
MNLEPPGTSNAVLAQVKDKDYELTKTQVIPITDDELRNLQLPALFAGIGSGSSSATRAR